MISSVGTNENRTRDIYFKTFNRLLRKKKLKGIVIDIDSKHLMSKRIRKELSRVTIQAISGIIATIF